MKPTTEPKPLSPTAKKLLLRARQGLTEIKEIAPPEEFQIWERFVSDDPKPSEHLIYNLKRCLGFIDRVRLRHGLPCRTSGNPTI